MAWNEEEDIAAALAGDIGARLRVEVTKPWLDLISSEGQKLRGAPDEQIDNFNLQLVRCLASQAVIYAHLTGAPNVLLDMLTISKLFEHAEKEAAMMLVARASEPLLGQKGMRQ